MTASPLIIPVARFFSAAGGAALAGGKVYTYESGTSTPKASYTDFTAATANQNPVVLDSEGKADIWLDGNYRINVLDSNDVQVAGYPVDNVASVSSGNESEYAVTTGSANAYVLTPAPAIVAYTAGTSFKIKVHAANTGPVTINISNLGTQSIVIGPSTALSGDEMLLNKIYTITYDGTNFQLEDADNQYPDPTVTQIQNNSFQYLGSTGGSDTAYTLTPAPAIAGLTEGQEFSFKIDQDNTGAATLAVSGLVATSIKKIDSSGAKTNVVAADLKANITYGVRYDGTDFVLTDNITPASVASATTTSEGTVELGTDAEVKTGTSTTLVSSLSAMGKHQGMAKAWACFDSDNGTLSIRDSYGISSITDNGVGDFTINFSTNFANTNYCYVANDSLVRDEGTGKYRAALVSTTSGAGNTYIGKTTSSMTLNLYSDAGGNFDDFDINVAFYGDQ